MFSKFIKYVLIGVVTVAPAAVVCYLAYQLFSYLDGIGQWIFLNGLGNEITGVGWILTITLLFIVGLLIKKTPAVRLLTWLEGYFIPKVTFFGSVYKSLRQFLDSMAKSSNQSFSKVVMVKWPDDQHLTLGFVTREYHFPTGNVAYCVEYLTTPNFTSGMPPALVRREDTIELKDVAVREGFEYVISAGLVSPEKLDLSVIEEALWPEEQNGSQS